ncbi:MAG: hypothetical protein HC833_10770 [Leptolyngbyaceae cyanobacterium RM1_406_9]|nr:hypothetical protein [Leptolyngbyaceae cyanobacterium RM1_406_9]
MTPFEIEQADQKRSEQQNLITQERRLDGAADAAFGRLPEYADDDYLAGYMAKLKELPRNPDGKIQHHSPHQHFAFGIIDGEGEF